MSTEEHLIQTRKIIVTCLNVHGYQGAKQSKRVIDQSLETEWQRSEIPFAPIHFRKGKQGTTDEDVPHYLCYNQLVVTTLSCACIDDEHRLEMYELLETLHYPMGIITAFGGRRLLAERIFSPVHPARTNLKQTSFGDIM